MKTWTKASVCYHDIFIRTPLCLWKVVCNLCRCITAFVLIMCMHAYIHEEPVFCDCILFVHGIISFSIFTHVDFLKVP